MLLISRESASCEEEEEEEHTIIRDFCNCKTVALEKANCLVFPLKGEGEIEVLEGVGKGRIVEEREFE